MIVPSGALIDGTRTRRQRGHERAGEAAGAGGGKRKERSASLDGGAENAGQEVISGLHASRSPRRSRLSTGTSGPQRSPLGSGGLRITRSGGKRTPGVHAAMAGMSDAAIAAVLDHDETAGGRDSSPHQSSELGADAAARTAAIAAAIERDNLAAKEKKSRRLKFPGAQGGSSVGAGPSSAGTETHAQFGQALGLDVDGHAASLARARSEARHRRFWQLCRRGRAARWPPRRRA